MKKIIICFLGLVLALPAFADGGVQYLNHCKDLYKSGRYELAKQGFTLCKVYDDIPDVEMDDWIAKCDNAITAKKNKAVAASRKARQAAYEESQRLRKDRNLVYISTNARTLSGDYPSMGSAIKGNMKQFHFSKEEAEARWAVYVTANAREYNNPNDLYIAYVDGIAQVVDLLSGEVLFEKEYTQKGGHAKGYPEAVRVAYDRVIKQISHDVTDAISQED